MKLDPKALERAAHQHTQWNGNPKALGSILALGNTETIVTAYLTAIGETHVVVPRGEGWQDIATAPKGQQIIGWEPNYGWLLVCHEYGEWRVKGSGNFWNSLPDTVTLTKWHPLPLVAAKEGE